MVFTPTACVSLQIEYARDMLAACTAFQEWSGEDTTTRAKTRIYFDRIPDPENGKTFAKGELQSKRPFAFVYLPDRNGLTRRRRSTHTFDEHGTVEIYLEQEVPEADDQVGPSEAARKEWHNWLGLIIGGNTGESTTGLCDLRVEETAGYLMFESIRLKDKAVSPIDVRATQGYYFWAVLELEF